MGVVRVRRRKAGCGAERPRLADHRHAGADNRRCALRQEDEPLPDGRMPAAEVDLRRGDGRLRFCAVVGGAASRVDELAGETVRDPLA